MWGAAVADEVDTILAQWARERPDVDTSPMGVFGRISRLDPRVNDRLGRVFGEFGLDFAGFDVLAALRRSGAPYELTPSQLAASMLVTPGAVAQRLVRLEDQGLVTRRHDNPDRRKVTVALTPPGLETINAAVVEHAANERGMLSVLTGEERDVLATLLRKLLISLGDEGR